MRIHSSHYAQKTSQNTLDIAFALIFLYIFITFLNHIKFDILYWKKMKENKERERERREKCDMERELVKLVRGILRQDVLIIYRYIYFCW